MRGALAAVFAVFNFPWIFVASRVLFGSVWGTGRIPYLGPWIAWQIMGWGLFGLVALYVIGWVLYGFVGRLQKPKAPDRETAYRYWGDALMGKGESGEARAKYIEAVIAEPYNRTAWRGLAAWAQAKRVRLTPPVIQSPHQVSVKNGTPNITIDAKSITQNDGTLHWLVYEITCADWKRDLFAKAYPDEKEYRHSLPEEAAALRKVAEGVSRDMKAGKIPSLDPSLATLVKLNDEGLLEPYVLLTRADAGIARDYATYRKGHRDKLRSYMDEYVVPKDQ